MAKRESRTAGTKRVPTQAQLDALAAGRAKKDVIDAHKREHPEDARNNDDRWAMLLSGTITVRDLDDKELKRMQVRNRAGGFAGTKNRVWPSHLRRQADNERIRRLNRDVKGLGPLAAKRLKELLNDPDTKPEVLARIIDLALQRSLGKVPDHVVHHEGDEITPWQDTDGVFGVIRDLDDADPNGSPVDP